VLISQVFFRSGGVRDALHVLGSMIGRHGHAALENGALRGRFTASSPVQMAVFFAVCFFIIWAMPNTQELLGQLTPNASPNVSLFAGVRWRPTLLWAVAIGCLCVPVLMLVDQSTNFLYFQF
jgi:alginate O-acetyltransferase complex protein AlgI